MFAYLDKYQILHVVDDKTTAKKYASGKIVETEIKASAGYPEARGNHVIVYAADKKYKVNGEEYPIAKLDEMYPDVAELLAKVAQ